MKISTKNEKNKIVVTAIQGLIDAADEQLNKRENSMDLSKVSHTHAHAQIRSVQMSELVIPKIRKISIEIGSLIGILRTMVESFVLTLWLFLKNHRKQPKPMEKYMKRRTPPQQMVTSNWMRRPTKAPKQNKIPMNSSKSKRPRIVRSATPVPTDLSR